MLRSTLKVFATVALFNLPTSARAADLTLQCAMGFDQGNGVLTVMKVEGHPELSMFKVNLKTRLARPLDRSKPIETVHLGGLFSAQTTPDGNVYAAGLMSPEADSPVFINSQLVTLQGGLRADGSYNLRLYDADHVLELGFGVHVDCR